MAARTEQQNAGHLFFHGPDFGLQGCSLLLVSRHLLGILCQLSLLLLQCLMSPPLLFFTYKYETDACNKCWTNSITAQAPA
jgi:hypothetical protein